MGKKNKGVDQLKFGKSFSARDIEKARSAGWNDNKILKAAASSSSVKNSANKALSSFNSMYLNPTALADNARGTESQVGSAKLLASYINYRQRDAAGNKDPKKVLSWNGVNGDGSPNALTINKPDTSNLWGGYRKDDGKGGSYGQWSTGKGSSSTSQLKVGGDGASTSGVPSPLAIGGGESGYNSNSSINAQPYGGDSMAGFDSSIGDSVTGFRRKRSRARMSGLTSKGTSQFKIGGQSSRSSGLNLGIG